MNKLFHLLCIGFIPLLLTAFSSLAFAGISLSQKDTDYVVARDENAQVIYVYGKLDSDETNTPPAKGTPVSQLPGNMCGNYASTNIVLRAFWSQQGAVGYVPAGEAFRGPLWFLLPMETANDCKVEKCGVSNAPSQKQKDIPSSCEDIGNCTFRCAYSMSDWENERPPKYVSLLKFADKSRDPKDKLSVSAVFYPDNLDKPDYDNRDKDADGDLVPDAVDNCKPILPYPDKPLSDQANQWALKSITQYGSLDLFKNFDQIDLDHNGIGDNCEDYDKDGVPDKLDNCSSVYNPEQDDVDGCIEKEGKWPTPPNDNQGKYLVHLPNTISIVKVNNNPGSPNQNNPQTGPGSSKPAEGEGSGGGSAGLSSGMGSGSGSGSASGSSGDTGTSTNRAGNVPSCTFLPCTCASNPISALFVVFALAPMILRRKR